MTCPWAGCATSGSRTPTSPNSWHRKRRHSRWSKWFLRPFFWAAGVAGPQLISDPEVRSKLSLFMRSRWFQPPLDGLKMAALMYDAVNAMGAPREPTSSLLPSGQGLDLFVTVTDFYGSQQLMQIHDPPVIHEREHRHVLHFKYRRRASGAVESDFDLENAPALAFAARATSSVPGAFPPARIIGDGPACQSDDRPSGRAARSSLHVISNSMLR